MKGWGLRIFLIVGSLLSFNVLAKTVVHSSISPEFPNGLHAKYLQFIVDKMGMELDLVPMPFARRIMELHNGKIDVMVGLRREKDEIDDIIYIYPSYEKLRQTFFVLAKNKDKFAKKDDMYDVRVGVTTAAKYYSHIKQNNQIPVVAVSTLKQKIELLLKGRIDCFIHYEESAEPVLQRMGLEEQVVVSQYQPNDYEEYYIAISKKSALLPHQQVLEKVVKEAVENGDFADIRKQHYH